MRLLRLTPEAIDDLDRIEQFNKDRSAAWAARVEQRLFARASTLPAMPYQGRLAADGETRLLSIPEFQYIITYRIDDDTILLVRVHHARENRRDTREGP